MTSAGSIGRPPAHRRAGCESPKVRRRPAGSRRRPDAPPGCGPRPRADACAARRTGPRCAPAHGTTRCLSRAGRGARSALAPGPAPRPRALRGRATTARAEPALAVLLVAGPDGVSLDEQGFVPAGTASPMPSGMVKAAPPGAHASSPTAPSGMPSAGPRPTGLSVRHGVELGVVGTRRLLRPAVTTHPANGPLARARKCREPEAQIRPPAPTPTPPRSSPPRRRRRSRSRSAALRCKRHEHEE